ncbi:MAG TPA: hypothetical protein PKE64_18320 [Anaerolineae bacterium]|nr:hypothetical protein [Anaerolineae bacterium]HMR65968.1 hypothetical protein [Anaerolineae bacterium]
MSRRITFEDGSAIQIASEIVSPGQMATDAYRRLMDFIEAELLAAEETDEEDLSDLDEEDFEDLDEEELEFDDEDMEDEDLWDDEEEFDDDWE